MQNFLRENMQVSYASSLTPYNLSKFKAFKIAC